MYNLSDIKGIHLEPTSKCQARCPQCGRWDFDEGRQVNKINPLITDREGRSSCLDQIDFKDFVKWFPPKFVTQLKYLYMCGTAGDPILADDCLKILAYLRVHNPKMDLSVHTNGGCKSKEWWTKLAKLRVKAIFGIDGLEDTHSLYRVNTKWKTVIKNACYFIRAGGNAEWQMLVFKHNEHQILKCSELSKKLGFKTFRYEHTSRFGQFGNDIEDWDVDWSVKWPVFNPRGEITHYLEPSSISLKYSCGDSLQPKSINCIAKSNSEIYVAANGRVLPCCHMESCFIYDPDDIEDYKEKIKVVPNLHEQSLKQIFDSLYFRRIQKSWGEDPLFVCSNTCGVCTNKTHQQSGTINF